MSYNRKNEIKQRAQGMDPYIVARNLDQIASKGDGNIYESLVIISKRSNQISVDLKKELNAKLDEFASTTDTLEEIHENKEQIEISKFYERLPNPSIIALNEFMGDDLDWKYKEDYNDVDILL
jgi:DNA-directed RNA polymerase subunit K/omega